MRNLPRLVFKKSDLKSQRANVLIVVDVLKFDAAWSRDEGFHIPVGQEGLAGRRNRFEDFLKTGEPIEAPNVSVTSQGVVQFGDGRHRFAVLRDLGYKEISVSVSKKNVALFNQFVLMKGGF